MFRECKCRKEQINHNRLKFANVPEPFRDLKLADFNIAYYKEEKNKKLVRIACKIIKNYIDNFQTFQENGVGLYIYSKTKGSGKTRMAASMANQFLADGHRVKFATSSEIIEQIKKTWDQDSKISERDLLSDLKDVEILIIDDFGAERNSDWINDKFYQIVNYRYINKLVTIYTSNYTENEIQYNERISSRIKECSYSVQFPEESIRDHIYEQRNNEMIKKILEGEV